MTEKFNCATVKRSSHPTSIKISRCSHDGFITWIPITEIISDVHRSHPAYGFQFWAPWRQGAQIGRPVYQFTGFSGDEKKVTSVCTQYMDILDALVKDFVSWRQASTGGAIVG